MIEPENVAAVLLAAGEGRRLGRGPKALLPLGAKPQRREGRASGRWVLIDFGDIVLQAFHEEDREFYDLERLWQDCPVIELELDEPADA